VEAVVTVSQSVETCYAGVAVAHRVIDADSSLAVGRSGRGAVRLIGGWPARLEHVEQAALARRGRRGRSCSTLTPRGLGSRNREAEEQPAGCWPHRRLNTGTG